MSYSKQYPTADLREALTFLWGTLRIQITLPTVLSCMEATAEDPLRLQILPAYATRGALGLMMPKSCNILARREQIFATFGPYLIPS